MTVKKSIYALILLTLIAFKVSSAVVHSYLHHENDGDHEDHCELCEQAINNQLLEFSTPSEFQVIEKEDQAVCHQQAEGYESAYVASFFNNFLFVRPPPHSS